jgi:hypothetical protein
MAGVRRTQQHARVAAPSSAAAALLVAAVAGADPAAAPLPLFGDSTFSATSTSTARWRGSNYDVNRFDDDFLALQQRLDLALQGEALRFDLRLDGFLPVFPVDSLLDPRLARSELFARKCPGGREAQCYLVPQAWAERALLRWDGGSATVEAGDSYAVLGRGLALTFRKADLLGVDNALRGLHGRWDDGTTLVKAHAGVSNPQNLDPTNLQLRPDPFDVVGGFELSRKVGPGEAVELGLQASGLLFQDLLEDSHLAWDRSLLVGGARLAAPALLDGRLALSLESDVLRRFTKVDAARNATENGFALYGSAQLQLDDATVLVEWVDYRNFMVAPTTLEGTASRIYGAAPTLELDGLQRLRGVGNRRGGSVKLDWAFLPEPWSVSANALVYGLDEDPRKDAWGGLLVTHGWVGAKRFNPGAGADDAFGWTFETLLGARQERYLHEPSSAVVEAGDVDRQVLHGEVDASIAFGAHSLEGRLDHRLEREFRFDRYVDFVQGGLTFTYTWALKFSLSPAVRWNTERHDLIRARDANPLNLLGGGYYPAVEARWNFSPGDFVSVFAGSTPGGRLCSGGVCRDVQSFEGVVAQAVLRL